MSADSEPVTDDLANLPRLSLPEASKSSVGRVGRVGSKEDIISTTEVNGGVKAHLHPEVLREKMLANGQDTSYDQLAGSLMNVATFSAGLTGGTVFALPTDETSTCNNCSAVTTVLSVAFLCFTISLFFALFVQIIVRTTTKSTKSILQKIYNGPLVRDSTLKLSAVFLAAGFLLDGVALVLIGKPVIGGLTIAIVGSFCITVFVWFTMDLDLL